MIISHLSWCSTEHSVFTLSRMYLFPFPQLVNSEWTTQAHSRHGFPAPSSLEEGYIYVIHQCFEFATQEHAFKDSLFSFFFLITSLLCYMHWHNADFVFCSRKRKEKKAFTMRTGGDTHRELGGTCCNSVKKDIWSLLSQHCDSSVFREGTSAKQKQICLLEGWEEACHGCWGRG